MSHPSHLSSSLLAAVLLISTLLSLSSAQRGALQFVGTADWPARAESSAYSNPHPQVVNTIEGRTLIPAGSIWVYGGLDQNDGGLSDVWVSTDATKSWLQVQSDKTVIDISRSADCYSHTTGRVYAISGSTPGSGDQRTSRIVASSDGVNWEIINEEANFLPRERPGCTVDSQGNVYMFGGSTRSLNGGSTSATNDIWVSRDLGLTFTRLSARAGWVQRISTDTQTHASPVFNKDIIYIESGDSGSAQGFVNDVWVSSDGARSWYQITAAAPFEYRKDAELTITTNGVLIVAGGDTDTSNANDLWASLDGGFTWGACCTKCGYEPREDAMGILDTNGYYYILGGDLAIDDDYSTYGNDVWKSTFSFNDPEAVSRYCNVAVPSDGVGLRCFPNGNGGCTSDSPGKLPGTNTSSSGLSGAMIGAIVFGVVVVVALLALLYRYKTKQPHERLLPFFGGGSKSAEGTAKDSFITGSTSEQYGQY